MSARLPGPSSAPIVDVLIAGGGLAGLSLALASGGALSVTLADPGFARPAGSDAGSNASSDDRAFAIAAAGRRMLAALGVWEAVSDGAEPITQMVITDSRTRDVVRPVYLTFGEPELAGDGVRADAPSPSEPFAHMVMSAVMTRALTEACRAAGVRLAGAAVQLAEPPGAGLAQAVVGGDGLRARLLVAADGKRSSIRGRAGIGWIGTDYAQSGIVMTVGHERPHGGRAFEHFLPAGPFAVLPLPDAADGAHRSSLVWTERHEDAANIAALGADDLLEELETRFGHQLGTLRVLSRPKAYPLSLGIARSFIGHRLALLGDAAHVIHPIAGQGLNLGLKDAASLAEAVIEAARLGLDIGSTEALKPYERARRADTVTMAAVTDGLNRLFSNDLPPLRLARDLGLGLVDRMGPLKDRLIAQASEARGGPRLLRGEPI
jgi:2-octaprenyl-6-methoxyphenol hydroxylase